MDDRLGHLFAALALAPPTSGRRRTDDDGFLELREVYDLRISETELVVLSASKANVEPTIEGHGVFALAEGFLAAGAEAVVLTHWPVAGTSTV